MFKGGVGMIGSKWITIAGTLMIGLFVAFLDRINLSIALVAMSKGLGFAGASFGVVSGWVLTSFLIGYGLCSFFGGILTRRVNPKTTVIAMMALWSIVTMLTGWVTSVTMLIVYRLILGVAEGVYYPQQSRFVRAWFSDDELSRANSLINFYGQSFGLALGYLILIPIFDRLGWQALFFVTGAAGLVIIIPLFAKFLKWDPQSKFTGIAQAEATKFSFDDLGGLPVLFLFFTYFAQASLFWGISLWIPMVVKSLNFTGTTQAVFSALPFFACLVLGAPISIISDRTGKRVLITALGLFIPGAILILLPQINDPVWKMAIITISFGYCASSFLPNILSIIQSSVKPAGVGPAVGMASGLGAAGGVVAGFVVGLLYNMTGSYTTGYAFLGILVMLGGVSIILHDRYKRKDIVTTVRDLITNVSEV